MVAIQKKLWAFKCDAWTACTVGSNSSDSPSFRSDSQQSTLTAFSLIDGLFGSTVDVEVPQPISADPRLWSKKHIHAKTELLNPKLETDHMTDCCNQRTIFEYTGLTCCYWIIMHYSSQVGVMIIQPLYQQDPGYLVLEHLSGSIVQGF
jgi:hypothetical protein